MQGQTCAQPLAVKYAEQELVGHVSGGTCSNIICRACKAAKLRTLRHRASPPSNYDPSAHGLWAPDSVAVLRLKACRVGATVSKLAINRQVGKFAHQGGTERAGIFRKLNARQKPHYIVRALVFVCQNFNFEPPIIQP